MPVVAMKDIKLKPHLAGKNKGSPAEICEAFQVVLEIPDRSAVKAWPVKQVCPVKQINRNPFLG